ncbi:MAG: hypothetical protein JXA94_02970 [Parachlamydiales bacterium]|nr:hypothetical protein [Parachlamydiales bacterium]
MKLTNDVSGLVGKAASCSRSQDFAAAKGFLSSSMKDTKVKRGVFGAPYVYNDNGWDYLSRIIDVALSIFQGMSRDGALVGKVSSNDKKDLKALLEMIKAKNEEISTETEKAGMINGTRANKIVQMEKLMQEISSKNVSWSDTFSRVPLLGRIFA